MSGSITSANSQILLAVATIFPVAQPIQGYSAEDIFESEDVELAEVQLGLDGKQASGWIPFNVKWRITLRANSDSISFFDTWIASQNALQDIYTATGTVTLKGPGKKYSLVNGTLTRGRIIPDAKKTLQPQTYEITWEQVVPAPM
ncbi:MAG: hypothetical protein EPN65_16775 [Pandoraea sp.]|uniref:phage tail fiber protein n=1 Tax=Pandoraea sp. TaxID=1883445 RepID=UPI0011F44E1E|nr:hypothetical protein [Pandoraea sp.]TAM15968.1 MAG: hypothetical protein EPN65_16775 [Pandoraea sp.]